MMERISPRIMVMKIIPTYSTIHKSHQVLIEKAKTSNKKLTWAPAVLLNRKEQR